MESIVDVPPFPTSPPLPKHPLPRCCAQVESAYDVVLMKSLMKRSLGEVSDNRVKYADVLSPGATVKQKLPPWARDLTNKLPPRPAFESPNSETLTQSGIALGVLAALVLAQGCTQVRKASLFFFSFFLPSRLRTPFQSPRFAFCLVFGSYPPPSTTLTPPWFFYIPPKRRLLLPLQPPGMDDPPGLQLSLALFGSVWLLRKKNLTLGAFAFQYVCCLVLFCSFPPFFNNNSLSLSPSLTDVCLVRRACCWFVHFIAQVAQSRSLFSASPSVRWLGVSFRVGCASISSLWVLCRPLRPLLASLVSLAFLRRLPSCINLFFFFFHF